MPESQDETSCIDNNFKNVESFKWKGDDVVGLYAFIWNVAVCVIQVIPLFQVFTVFLLTEYIW